MRELRQFVAYFFGVVSIVAFLSASAMFAGFEGIHYVPTASSVSAVKKGAELAGIGGFSAPDDGPPVWIAPTPKYDYDPKLMIVKSREERLKEAELKRKQQAAEQMGKQRAVKRAQRKIASQRRERQLREAGNAYAYKPEVRQPVFGVFSIFQ